MATRPENKRSSLREWFSKQTFQREVGRETSAKDQDLPQPPAVFPAVPLTTQVQHFFRNPFQVLRRFWVTIRTRLKTSVQARFLLGIFVSVVMIGLVVGLVVMSVLSSRVIAGKEEQATYTLDRARTVVEAQLGSVDSTANIKATLNNALSAITDRSATVDQTTASAFGVVLISQNSQGEEVAVPDAKVIPESLRTVVREGQVARQYTTLETSNGKVTALITGTPLASNLPNAEMYLIESVAGEEATISLFRSLILAAGIIIIVLILIISWLFSQSMIRPITQASNTARKLSNNEFRTRMAVDGQDEFAVLAQAFNSMAEKLEKQIRELEEFGTLQQQFTQDVSHELRSPLTSIIMAVDLLNGRKDEYDESTVRILSTLDERVNAFDELLVDLLEISRHDAKQTNLDEQRVDTRGLVRAVQASSEPVAEKLDVPVVVDLPEEAVHAVVDVRRVERVLSNLVNNAIDHAQGNPVVLTLRDNDEAISITVADNGVGMKESEQERVFNRFWRADPSRKRETGGTGLGLAIARENALLHGGTLEVISESGVGSTFRVTLPKTPHAEFTSHPLPLEVMRPVVDVDELPGLGRADRFSEPDESDAVDTADTAVTVAEIADTATPRQTPADDPEKPEEA